jgi:two-component system response regulator YesN
MRMKSAKELLSDSDIEIRSVAEKVGYQSYNGFYLAFKRAVGMTPEEYRDAKGRKQ